MAIQTSLVAAVTLLAASSHAASITTPAQLTGALSSVTNLTGNAYFSAFSALLQSIVPATPPTTTSDAASRVAAAYAAYPNNPNAAAAALLLSGAAGAQGIKQLTSLPTSVPDLSGYGICNSYANVNPRAPFPPVYPIKAFGDAPYDIPESQLRAAIYIPPGFTYGQKPPVLFIPGTGVEACENFLPNFGTTLANVAYADLVYVNVPNNMLDDIQNNAEYVAYAINYIQGITKRNVSLITWSQGSIASQWAFKYWPSTRRATSDMINISGDYSGTILAPLICPGTGVTPGFPCPPSIYQQFTTSQFIKTLRNNGGDSAYVPTTSVWTIYDEIVEPQQIPIASANINDARGVGVLDAQLQGVCPIVSVAASPNFGHEATLYNAISYDLAVDALKNAGPGNVARSGATNDCGNFAAPGLGLVQILETESTIPIAAFNIVTYPNKVTQEPPIKAYAQKDTPPF